MAEVEVLQVIRTDLERRGSGRDETDPIRRVTQYWTMDGDLLVEFDSFAKPTKPEITLAVGDTVRDGTTGLGYTVTDQRPPKNGEAYLIGTEGSAWTAEVAIAAGDRKVAAPILSRAAANDREPQP